MTSNPFAISGISANLRVGATSDAPAAVPVAGASVRDVIIVGSGPAGYTAAIYCARNGLNPLVLEGSIDAGGALMKTTEVDNYPGFPDGIMGPELMALLREQAERFGTEFITDDAVRLQLEGGVKEVEDSDGNIHRARAVILAMGSSYRRLGLPEEDTYAGKGVSWCGTCDGFFFKGKNVAVVGGGDAAAEEALFLTRFADRVTLIHRRGTMRASKFIADRVLADPQIVPSWHTEIIGMSGDPNLQALTLRNCSTGEISTLEVEGLFESIGHDPRSHLVAGQVELDAAGYVKVDEPSTRTNLPGVFACGDLVDHTYRQAVTAAGTGCRAALDAQEYLDVLPVPVGGSVSPA